MASGSNRLRQLPRSSSFPESRGAAARSPPLAALLLTLLLMRRIGSIGKFSILLWVGVLATIAIVIGAGLPHIRFASVAFWNAPRLDSRAGWSGLGVALIFAVYDYLGYYNICYIGDEIHEPDEDDPPRHRDLDRRDRRSLPADERLPRLRAADEAGDDLEARLRRLPRGPPRIALGEGCLDPDPLDRPRVDLLAHARLLADPLRRGARRELLLDLFPAPPERRVIRTSRFSRSASSGRFFACCRFRRSSSRFSRSARSFRSSPRSSDPS